MIRIDEDKCREVAARLQRITIPASEEEGPLPYVSREQLANYYGAVVAICHQTSPLGGPVLRGRLASGEECFGWDYLRKRFAERVGTDSSLLKPSTWESMLEEQLIELLTDVEGRATLIDTRRRAGLLRDLGRQCQALHWEDLNTMYSLCGGWLNGGPYQGLYAQLSCFEAYSDPVRKKSSFFLELMRGQGGWVYSDPANLGAPVDYHEVRGHLRIGTVVVEDHDLEEQLRQRRNVSDKQDVAIRKAVYDAINLISSVHGTCDPATLHYLFWNTFRQCCSRDQQHCEECPGSCGLPQRYRHAFATTDPERCFFAPVCTSAGKPDKLIEHQHYTDYY